MPYEISGIYLYKNVFAVYLKLEFTCASYIFNLLNLATVMLSHLVSGWVPPWGALTGDWQETGRRIPGIYFPASLCVRSPWAGFVPWLKLTAPRKGSISTGLSPSRFLLPGLYPDPVGRRMEMALLMLPALCYFTIPLSSWNLIRALQIVSL